MHAAIFWGFVLLTIGTANIVTGGLIQAILSIPFDGALWAAVTAIQNVVAVVVLVGVAWALCRRVVVAAGAAHARRATRSIILLLIGGVVATELLAEVFEVAAYGRSPGAFVVERRSAGRSTGLRPGALEALFAVAGGRTSSLVASSCATCRSKHLHIVTAFLNIALRKLAPRGELPAMDLEAEDATFGIKTVEDLSWKDLLDGFTCTECGRCQEACPAWATGKPLNPKTFIMGIREMAVEAEHGLPLIPNSPSVRATSGLDDTLRRRGARAADRRHRDPVRRGLGLRDLRRVRRGVPGARSSTSTRSSGCGATSCSRSRASRRS